jgi:hypothetical protein
VKNETGYLVSMQLDTVSVVGVLCKDELAEMSIALEKIRDEISVQLGILNEGRLLEMVANYYEMIHQRDDLHRAYDDFLAGIPVSIRNEAGL